MKVCSFVRHNPVITWIWISLYFTQLLIVEDKSLVLPGDWIRGVPMCVCVCVCVWGETSAITFHWDLSAYISSGDPTHTHTHMGARARTHTHTHTHLLLLNIYIDTQQVRQGLSSMVLELLYFYKITESVCPNVENQPIGRYLYIHLCSSKAWWRADNTIKYYNKTR